MATQTTAQLEATLGLRMEDPDELKFTSAYKVKALNYAQQQVAQMLDVMYLNELQVAEAEAMTGSTNYTISFTDFTTGTKLNGAQSFVAVKDASNWLAKTTLAEQRRLENTLLASGATNKVYYIFDEKLWIKNGGTATDTITAYYLKIPPTMVSGGQAPVLNEALYDIMLRFAEAQLWRADDQLERADVAYQEAMDYIDFLNALAIQRRPKGIGTKKENREKVQR